MKKKLTDILYSFSLLLFITAFGFQHNPPSGWYQQFMPPEVSGAEITDITFTDSLTGYASTNIFEGNSYILKTINGGDNWTVKLTHTNNFVRVRFLDNNTGFTNAFQTILKTTNGGENWISINLQGDLFGDDMYVLNEDTIWLAQSTPSVGGVFRTTNGGTSWVRQFGGFSGNPNKVYFYDANLGFINNGIANSLLRRTTDGGVTWVDVPGAGGFTDLKFIDENTGWKARGNIMMSTDGGLSWIAQQIPGGGNIIVSSMEKFSTINKDTIWGIGGYTSTGIGARGILYRTTNSGENWYYQVPDSTINIFKYFHLNFVNEFIGWAYSPSPGIHTKSGGDTIFLSIALISSEIPTDFTLYQNYPNPFNPTTRIRFDIQSLTEVKLVVHDILGKQIEVLVNEKLSAGSYEYTFDARLHGQGSSLPSGVYFYSLIIEETVQTKKMLLTK